MIVCVYVCNSIKIWLVFQCIDKMPVVNGRTCTALCTMCKFPKQYKQHAFSWVDRCLEYRALCAVARTSIVYNSVAFLHVDSLHFHRRFECIRVCSNSMHFKCTVPFLSCSLHRFRSHSLSFIIWFSVSSGIVELNRLVVSIDANAGHGSRPKCLVKAKVYMLRVI